MSRYAALGDAEALAPAVAVICGGGPSPASRSPATCGTGRPLLAVASSGGVADELPKHAFAPAGLVDADLAALGV